MLRGVVVAVARSAGHTFSKSVQDRIRLFQGIGVEGDVHSGSEVQHASRVAKDPGQPNLRQVHLIHAELHDELRVTGFIVQPGDMGENITTRGVDLPGLPAGTRLYIGDTAVVEVTGLRNPCVQLDRFQDGLQAAVVERDRDGHARSRLGVMGIVVVSGDVRAGDMIGVELPAGPHERLRTV